jgi:hypothetical protein
MVRILWLLGRLQRFGSITAEVALREYGMSLRSYRRDIARLRNAGFRLMVVFTTAHGGSRDVQYGGFDETWAEAVRGGPYLEIAPCKERQKRLSISKRSHVSPYVSTLDEVLEKSRSSRPLSPDDPPLPATAFTGPSRCDR